MCDYKIELNKGDLAKLLFDGRRVFTVCGVDRNVNIELVYANAVSRKKKPDASVSVDMEARCSLTVEEEKEERC